jgi:hypothetical protein
MVAIDPAQRLARAQIDRLRAAAKAVEPGLGAGQRSGKAPFAVQVERIGTAQQKADDMLGFAKAIIVVDPKRCRLMRFDACLEAKTAFVGLFEVELNFVAQRQGTDSAIGGADVELA